MRIDNNNNKVNSLENIATNGLRITERKKETRFLSYSMLQRAKKENNKELEKRAERSLKCSDTRHIVVVNGQAYTTFTHRCKSRHCQECQRIKAFVWGEKVKSIMPELNDNYASSSYLFVTFTVKNPKVADLRKVLKAMNRASNLMFKRKAFKIVQGGIRSTEITRGKSGADECHPHFHYLLMVPPSYFCKKSKNYIKSDDWGQAWGDCLALEFEKEGLVYNKEDYPKGFPRVDVVRARSVDGKSFITNENIKQNGEEIINYVLKYSVKGSDIIDHKKGVNDEWFFTFDKQIKGVRSITPVGVFKEYLSKIKKEPFSYDAEMEKMEKLVSQDIGYIADKVNFKEGKYIKESEMDRGEYIRLAVDAKAHNIQQYYFGIWTEYIEIYRKINIEIENILSHDIDDDFNTQSKLFSLILSNNDRAKRINALHQKMVRVGYMYEVEKGVYNTITCDYIDDLPVNDVDEISKLEVIYIDDFEDVFNV